MWEKDKLLVTSNLSFSNSVFKRFVLQTNKNQDLFGKGLTNYHTKHFKPTPRLKGHVYADNKINVTQNLKFVLGRVENIAGKGENDGYQHFLLFQQCFQKASYPGLLTVLIVWYRVNTSFKIIRSFLLHNNSLHPLPYIDG